VDHLEAQRANIEHLTFGYMLQTNRGDIAYHIRLTDQAQDQELTEGIVVGFFPLDGKTKIEPLCSENINDAVMAGVISRSAYIEADVPEEKDKGNLYRLTDYLYTAKCALKSLFQVINYNWKCICWTKCIVHNYELSVS
jgi:hypothetical protein